MIFCSSLNGAWKTSIFLDRSKMKELNMKEIAVVDWLLTSMAWGGGLVVPQWLCQYQFGVI